MTHTNRQFWVVLIGSVALFVAFLLLTTALFGVNFDYTLTVVTLGGGMLGIVSGVLGTFVVLRKQSLMGDALSHAALPGVAVAFLFFGREIGALLLGAALASWLGIQFIVLLTSTTRIKQDTAMGIVLAAWFAFGLALLSYIQARPDASQAGLNKFIFGQAAAMTQSDVVLITGAGFIGFLIIAALWKELKLLTFDPEFAKANGFPTRILDILLSTLIVAGIVLGLQLAGVILMVGMLIAPAAAARQWTQRFGQMMILSAMFGAFAGGTGAIISAIDVNMPTGPLMIVVASALVFVSICAAPGRGIVWAALQHYRDKTRLTALRNDARS